MPDTVAVRKIHEGPRYVTYRFTNQLDGTGEAAVQKVDVSGLTGPDGRSECTHLAIKSVKGHTNGMSVQLLADATANQELVRLNGDLDLQFEIPANPSDTGAAGFTGDILLTTLGHGAGDTYDLEVQFIKKQ